MWQPESVRLRRVIRRKNKRLGEMALVIHKLRERESELIDSRVASFFGGMIVMLLAIVFVVLLMTKAAL